VDREDRLRAVSGRAFIWFTHPGRQCILRRLR
jgi:hypothetical protein